MSLLQFWSSSSDTTHKVTNAFHPVTKNSSERGPKTALKMYQKTDLTSSWLKAIQQQHVASTPYMLTDLTIIRERCKTFKKLLPEVGLYYAVKAFSDREVIMSISDIVDGFDVASIDEINRLLSLGVDPQRIIYSNPVKPREAIAEAILRGIDKFSFQSHEELHKIAASGQPVSVFVRTKMDDAHSAVPLSTKFGCRLNEAVGLLKYAKQLQLRPMGVTFHVGSQQQGLGVWSKAIKASQNLLQEAKREGLESMVINIGGGFPVRYQPDDPQIQDVAQVINRCIKPKRGFRYVAEPGRYVVAESSVIVCSIIGIERRHDTMWLFLDVGLFQAFSGAQRFDPFPYPPFAIDQSSKLIPTEIMGEFILTGPSCDSYDIIAKRVVLPKNLTIGDRLVFPNTGAYTVVYGSNFNGFAVPQRFFITDKRPKKTKGLV